MTKLLELPTGFTREGLITAIISDMTAEIERLRSTIVECKRNADVALSEENDRLIDDNKRLRAQLEIAKEALRKIGDGESPYDLDGPAANSALEQIEEVK